MPRVNTTRIQRSGCSTRLKSGIVLVYITMCVFVIVCVIGKLLSATVDNIYVSVFMLKLIILYLCGGFKFVTIN